MKKPASRGKRDAVLELRPPELRKNMIALLEKVENDKQARQAFIDNPTKVMISKVAHVKASASQVSESNRLLFALLANDKMLDFLAKFEASTTNRKAAKLEFAAAFASKIAELKDENITIALLGNTLVGNGVPGLSQIAYQCVTNETTGKTSTACTPVAKNSIDISNSLVIDPETIRALSEALVARAKKLAKAGAIANLNQRIG